MGEAMHTVAAAYAAAGDGRFDDLARLLAPDIDWWGLAGADGEIPHCHGRAAALKLMRRGRVARGEVSVTEFAERGVVVLASVAAGETDAAGERFVLAEVHDGQITGLRAFATESEARASLDAGGLSTEPRSPRPAV